MNALHVLLMMFVLLGLGIPISYSMLAASGLYLLLSDIPFMTLMHRLANSVNSVPLLAVPAFILAGNLMNSGGMTRSLFRAVNTTFVGRLRGGLAQINVLVSLIFSGMSGAALADIGGLGAIEIEAMEENGYKSEDAIAVTLASSAIGPIFPPSIPLIIYASIAQVSSLRILVAGMLPGITMTVVMLIQVAIMARIHNYPRGEMDLSFRERIRVQLHALPALLAPIILLAGLVTGAYSPTELASVAAVYAFIVGLLYYKSGLKSFLPAIRKTVRDVGNVMLIAAAAFLFSYVMTIEQIPRYVTQIFLGLTDNLVVVVLVTNLLLLVLGMFLPMMFAILVLSPIIVPVLASFGMDPIHIGVMIVFNLVIGIYTPPYGNGLFLASAMTGRPVLRIVRALLPYYIPLIVALLLVSFIPALTTWLPNLVMGR